MWKMEMSADIPEFARSSFEDPIKANPCLFAIRGGYLHVLGIGTVSSDWALVGFADDAKLFEFV
jgi:hypothetical protein